jgi:hypothetical protein
LTSRFPLDTDYDWHEGFHAGFFVTSRDAFDLASLNVTEVMASYLQKKVLNNTSLANGTPVERHGRVTAIIEGVRQRRKNRTKSS